jgi:hypothetical protein
MWLHYSTTLKTYSSLSFFNIIKKQFTLTKIPKDHELEYDICMKCGRRLTDKKYSTWKEHQDKIHPLTLKEKRKAFFAKHPIISMLAIMIGAMILVVNPAFTDSINQFGYNVHIWTNDKKPMLDAAQIKACDTQVLKFKQDLYNEKAFSANDAGRMNDLMNTCYVYFGDSQFGPTLFDNKNFDTSNNIANSKP